MTRTCRVLFSAIALAASAAAAPPAPKADGWVAPDLDQLRKDAWRKGSPTAYARVKLDMDGDGLKDDAMLVTHPVRHSSALRICLASKNPQAPRNCHILGEVEDETGYEVMGLLVVAPGCHDYFALDDGTEVDGRFCTRTEVLDYFREGSAASYYVYDRKTGTFNRYWYSD